MVAATGLLSSADTVVDADAALPVGTPVVDSHGEKLGRLVGIDRAGLLVEHGIFFVSTLVVPDDAVERVEDGTIVLGWTKAELQAAS